MTDSDYLRKSAASIGVTPGPHESDESVRRRYRERLTGVRRPHTPWDPDDLTLMGNDTLWTIPELCLVQQETGRHGILLSPNRPVVRILDWRYDMHLIFDAPREEYDSIRAIYDAGWRVYREPVETRRKQAVPE